jgi:hypothetical protein
VLSRDLRQQLVETATQIADKYGLPRQHFIAQIQLESGFNPTARGKAGEIGIAQIIPKYHPGVNPYDPVQSLDYMGRFIATTAERLAPLYGPELAIPAAAAAWNAGTPAVAAGRIPSQTLHYIARIFGPDTAHALAARARGAPPHPPLQHPNIAPQLQQATQEVLQRPSISQIPDPRLRLILEGLMLLRPEIVQALPPATQQQLKQQPPMRF